MYGSYVKVEYLQDTDEILFNVRVKINTYIAIGFGKDMTQTEMVQWYAAQLSRATEAVGVLQTYYSTGHRVPLMDIEFQEFY